ncbi:MAG TPA: formylglycine-generating enzyme family protein [Planctomycetota bacterium]|nr:formylglycine-generating enzyme family protein [Planctomycetota bacterium]
MVEPSRDKAGQTNYMGGRITPAHPVELVDSSMCELLLTRYGMVLPTEAQWEYACRGGTTTPWMVPRERLVEVANLADATAQECSSGSTYEAWRDGYVTHAPVGSFAPNGFGLFDMQGNVGEICRDRGSSFFLPAGYARSANRNNLAPSVRISDLGTRPARLMHPLDRAPRRSRRTSATSGCRAVAGPLSSAPMKLTRVVTLAALGWTAAISSLHAWLNLDLSARAAGGPSFRVGFLPVT